MSKKIIYLHAVAKPLIKQVFITLFLFSSFFLFAQELKPKKMYTRVVAGPVLSFYKNNKVHTSGTKPGSAFSVGVFEEIRMYNDFSFVPGIEYAYHGLSFSSYYLGPGYQTLYDKRFDYNYTLRMQEGRLNILFRQVLGIETRNPITGYFEYGYVLRSLFNARLKVTSNLTGTELYNGKPTIAFEHPVITNSMASALKLVVGAQENFFRSHRALFFECSFMYSLSRFSIKNSFAPTALYINSSFLQLGLGVKL